MTMKSFLGFFILLIGIISIASSCTVEVNAQGTDIIPNNHIIFFGLDGWSKSSFDKANMPFVKGVLNDGAWTLQKRSILPSGSACNWATMFMGVGPEAHGFVDWNTSSPEFLQTETMNDGFFPNVFSLYRQKAPNYRFVYYYQWSGMKSIVNNKDFNSIKSFSDSYEGTNQLAKAAQSYILEKKPAIGVFIWDHPDHEGHNSGWETDEYLNELTHLDSIINDTVQACKEAGIYDNTLFIITSDHGGHELVHGTYDIRDLETPLILFGAGVKKGVEITTPVMQYDVAAIIADYLHIEHPASWRGVCPIGIFD